MRILIILTFVLVISALDNKCSLSKDCPKNAYCNPTNQLCVCQAGYIANCALQARNLTSTFVSVTLQEQQIQYFYINPMKLDHYIEFTITFCEQNLTNNPLKLSFWGQTGKDDEYNENNTLVGPYLLIFEHKCSAILIPQAQFKAQANGQNEMLIMGLQAMNSSSATTIDINVNQRIAIQIYISYYLMMTLISFLFTFFLVCTLLVIFKRFQRQRIMRNTVVLVNGQRENNIEYFNVFLPSTKYQSQNTEVLCSICLQGLEPQQQMRNTPCDHIFHTSCLDAWCKKSLNCPVCRNDLSFDNLKAVRDSLKTAAIENKNKGYQQNWEQNVEQQIQNTIINPQSAIKQNML